MDTQMLTTQFERIGARVKVGPMAAGWRGLGRPAPGAYRIDVGRDARGEFFSLEIGPSAGLDLRVIDARPDERHLVLLARDDAGKHKFLCGHDERAWFVAAVPEAAAGVRDVFTAKEALKPREVRIAQDDLGVRRGERGRRRTAAYVRQGEWFFTPAPDLKPEPFRVLRREPIRRGGGKPHGCEFLYREAGTQVYVNAEHPNGITAAQFAERVAADPAQRRRNWRVMVRDARVYVKGRVSHPDHRTIILAGWHRVQPNREVEAAAMRQVAFLD